MAFRTAAVAAIQLSATESPPRALSVAAAWRIAGSHVTHSTGKLSTKRSASRAAASPSTRSIVYSNSIRVMNESKTWPRPFRAASRMPSTWSAPRSLPRSASRAEVSRTRTARLAIFALPVAPPFAEEGGDLAASPGPAEGPDRIGGERDHPRRPACDDPLQNRRGADLQLPSDIRRNGHLTALGHPCTHMIQFTSYAGAVQA